MLQEIEIREILMKYARVEDGFELQDDMGLIEDLKYDSLLLIEFLANIENLIGEEFDNNDMDEISELVDCVGDLVQYIYCCPAN